MCTSVTAIHPPSASGASFVVSSLSNAPGTFGPIATDLLRPLRMISFFRYLDQFVVYLCADWTVVRRMCTSVTAIHPPSASGASFVVSSLSNAPGTFGPIATDLLRPLRMISFFRYLDQFLVYLCADWTVGRRMCTSVTAIHPPSASGASFVVSSLSRRCADLLLTKPAQCVPEGGAAKRHGTASGAAELSSASRVHGLPRRDEDRRLVRRAPAPNKSYSKSAHG